MIHSDAEKNILYIYIVETIVRHSIANPDKKLLVENFSIH